MSAISNQRKRLFCPGPTPVPNQVAIASLETDHYHRSASFKEIIIECRRKLKPFFNSVDDPVILSSSGTGALETALVNLTDEGDEVITVNAGKFGERWSKLAKAYRCEMHEIKLAWGQALQADEIKSLLQKHPKTKAVFMQANETSTGVALPIKELAAAIRSVNKDVLIVVDGVSALIAHEVNMQDWDLDCLVSGSQKGFGIPPGLAFIACSERAKTQLSQRPRFYFDYMKELEGQNTGQTAWTPPTTLLLSLNAAMDHLLAMGPEGCFRHHDKMARATRAAVKALGLELFSQSHHSNSLTAAKIPTNIDGVALVKHCIARYGAYFAGGQDEAKGKIVRIAHLGIFDRFDTLSGLSALEFGLRDCGYSFELGVGVQAAMKVMAEET